MLIEIKVPQLAEGTPEGTLAAWHVKAGDTVKRDQNLCDIETDKVVLETPAQGDGVLVEIKVQPGSTVTSGVVLGVIDTDAKAGVAAPVGAAHAANAPASVAVTAKAAPTEIAALPAARKMMVDQGIDAATVQGTGRGDRITKGDVIAAVGAGSTAPSAKTASKTSAPCSTGSPNSPSSIPRASP